MTPAEKPKRPPIFHVNAILFVVLMIGSTVWLAKHVRGYFEQWLLFGGVMSVVGVVQLSKSWFKWGWGDDAKGLFERLLSRRPTTEYLGVGLVTLVALFFTTSSFTVRLGHDAAAGQTRIAVRGQGPRVSFSDTLGFASGSGVYTRPFLLQSDSVHLEFTMVGSRDRGPFTCTMRRGAAIDVEVPTAFAPVEFHALRIVPGPRVYALLPRAEDSVEVPYHLVIRAGGHADSIVDLRRGAVYFGAPESDLSWLVEAEGTEGWRESVIRMWQSSEQPNRGVVVASTLERNSVFLGTPGWKLSSTDTVRVEVRQNGKLGGVATIVPKQKGIETVFVP